MSNKTVLIDSYANLELYLIPVNGEVEYKVKHKDSLGYSELAFVLSEGFLVNKECYPLSVLEWATVGDWANSYLNND